MRTTRLVAFTVAAGLGGIAPMAVAAPSQAADTYKSYVVASPSATQVYPRWDPETGVFEDAELEVDFDLDSESGSAPTGGTTTLLAQKAGSSEWVPVAESTSATSSFTGVRPTVRTTYKAVYSGYTSSSGDTYQRAESATFIVSVARRITFPVAGFVIKGTVAPKYGKKKIVVRASRQRDSGFKPFKTIRTSRTGAYKITLPRRGGQWFWSFRVKGDASYLPTGFVWRTFIG